MRMHHNGGRARLGLATVLALAVGLAGSTGATAAPFDNLTNARKCLRGGWQSLHPSSSRSFRSLAGCLIFALRGGTFYVAPPASGSGL